MGVLKLVKLSSGFLPLLICLAAAKCPCSDTSLCSVVSQAYDTQVFAFSVKESNFKNYDFTRLGTIATGYTISDPQLVCHAHSFRTRVVSMANFPVENLTKPETFKPWVAQQVAHVQDNMLDGVNVDFESAILRNETNASQGFNKLMSMLTATLKSINKNYQVSIDFAWSPACIDGRCYDFAELARIVDLAFIMAYDERSQFPAPCIAWANAPYNMTVTGVSEFLKLKIPARKMILGVPWYGYRYPCVDYNEKDHTCTIKKVPFRGSECSDAAGREISYSEIPALLKSSLTGRLWNDDARSPYFTYKEAGQLYQMWYDDVESLHQKYRFALDLRLAGVGMWEADALDYTDKRQVDDFWKMMPEKKRIMYKKSKKTSMNTIL